MESDQPKLIPMGQLPPPLIRMVEKPGRGRTYIAASPIERGQVVLIDLPFILYPASLSCITVFCSYCFRVLPSKRTFTCLSCNIARFCSARCLVKSHPTLLCQALPSLSRKPPCSPELLFLLCVYCLQPDMILHLLSLHSNPCFSPDDELIGTLHSEFRSHIPPHRIPPYFSRQITSYLLSKEKTNSFPIFNPRHPQFRGLGVAGVRAYGLYIRASMLNHDCMPNVCVFNYIDDLGRENNFNLIFRALDEIQEGTELCISYVALDMGYQERQRRLLEDYGFECECLRCDIESQWKENRRGGEGEGEGEEEGNEEEVKLGKGIRDLELPEEVDDSFPHSDFFEKHMCDCGGCLVPFPSSDDRSILNLKECNNCGGVRKDESAGAGEGS